MARLGNLGVHTLEELQTFSARVSTAQRRKRHLAEGLPHAPGVYLFRDERERVLYVGTSKDLRTRVRSYFTASETRSRMGEMVNLASTVQGIECATALEAEVRELRLIAEHKPRYNRRSRFPERVHWVKLTVEPWPRLSLVRRVLDDGAEYVGPFGSKRTAERCLAALHETFRIRQCGGRMPKVPSLSACALAEMGRCLSPCNGSVDPDRYAAEVERLRAALVGGPDEVVGSLTQRMAAAGPRRTLRGSRTLAGPPRRLSAGCGADPATQGPHPVRRSGRRTSRERPVVGPRRPARQAGSRRRHSSRCPRRRLGAPTARVRGVGDGRSWAHARRNR